MSTNYIISNSTRFDVFEHPDGSETIYFSVNGSELRVISHEYDTDLVKMVEWCKISKVAEDNESLQNAIEHCIMLYHMITGK